MANNGNTPVVKIELTEPEWIVLRKITVALQMESDPANWRHIVGDGRQLAAATRLVSKVVKSGRKAGFKKP